MDKNFIKIKVNVDLPARKGFRALKAGDTIRLAADKDGRPTDAYWSRRYSDSKIDKCIEVVRAHTTSGSTPPKKRTKRKSEENERTKDKCIDN